MNKRAFLITIASLFAFSASIAIAGSENRLIERVGVAGAKNISHPTCEITNYAANFEVEYIVNDGWGTVWKSKSKYRNQADLYTGDVSDLDLKVIQQLKKNGFKISAGAFEDLEVSPLTFYFSIYSLDEPAFGDWYTDRFMAKVELLTNEYALRGDVISGVQAYSKSFRIAGIWSSRNETRVAATYDALFEYVLANLPTCTIAK
ncbi:hypothetical protein ACLVWU_10090 [Bdellovibrio sp. HCB290]|uniref:hypothetical protein n=1 Tax=Bdellovibrio sp. HCB290 TaxID=3394356 RepID=UPI0039B6586F